MRRPHLLLLLLQLRLPIAVGFGVSAVRGDRSIGRTSRTSVASSSTAAAESRWSAWAHCEREASSCVVHRHDASQGWDDRFRNLASPRDWLEYQADGVYTVLRADVVYRQGRNRLHLWGLSDFHVPRLESSMRALMAASSLSLDEEQLLQQIQQATQDTNRLVQELLILANHEVAYLLDKPLADPAMTCVVMLTLLWVPPKEDASNIAVLGHVYTTGQALVPQLPKPVTAMIAWTGEDATTQLPNRQFSLPEAKQSAWCTQRRPLEDAFQTQTKLVYDLDVGEVILVDAQGEVVNLLEGLTSNILCLYPDNRIRTPVQGMLPGYARHLVLAHARQLGCTVEEGPIALHEAALWQEVWLTSAIKLLVPVEQICVKHADSGTLRVLWSRDTRDIRSGEREWSSRVYERILKEELQREI